MTKILMITFSTSALAHLQCVLYEKSIFLGLTKRVCMECPYLKGLESRVPRYSYVIL